MVGLLGSNGAGKSTTMNIICGVMRQTAGEVYIGGINTLKEPVKARKLIGFLPQKPPLYPDLTVDEYLRFCAEIQWMDKKKIKSAIAAAEERCGITHMKDRLLRNLSGGYQQRVGLAQAILHDPKFVVLDDRQNGLEPEPNTGSPSVNQGYCSGSDRDAFDAYFVGGSGYLLFYQDD